MNTDTLILLIVALASVLALTETLWGVFRERPGTQAPPRSHDIDRQFAPPSSWAA